MAQWRLVKVKSNERCEIKPESFLNSKVWGYTLTFLLEIGVIEICYEVVAVSSVLEFWYF